MKQEVKHEHSVNYEAKKERLLFAYPESRSLGKKPIDMVIRAAQSCEDSVHIGLQCKFLGMIISDSLCFCFLNCNLSPLFSQTTKNL